MTTEPPVRLPRVPLGRRSGAFLIDFFVAGAVSSLLGGALLIPIFILAWFGLRVAFVFQNRGQSIGRYAFDIKLVDARAIKIPTMAQLLKREGIVGLGAMLAWIGVTYLSPTNAWAVLLMVPLIVDCGFAFADQESRLAFHDQVARTFVLQSRRGYSLDLKLKMLVDKINIRMPK